MALRTVISSRIPMVIILGATGTGKTKLGVELAQKFGTEIISADSMQIYKGLDVVTAKASVQEREMARHHLLDLLEPHQMFTVVDFRNRALKIIDNLIEQGKTPIIVGGTNYYIESIVYKILVEDMDDEHALLWEKSRRKRDYDDDDGNKPKKLAVDSTEQNDTKTVEGSRIIASDAAEDRDTNNDSRDQVKHFVDNESNFTNEEVHAQLQAIDPTMAARLHPNNRRKVLRLDAYDRNNLIGVEDELDDEIPDFPALDMFRDVNASTNLPALSQHHIQEFAERSIEVWLKSGRRHSEVLAEQKETEGELRRPGATVILWLKCEQEVHDKRLDDRVDKMLAGGLIEELLDFHARHNKQRIKDGAAPDYTKGVFQTLGFKEFHDYLMLSDEERNTEEGRKLIQESIDNMKRGTRRYARRQNKIVRGRFLEHPGRQVPPIYELDTTELSKWDENVKNKAIEIIESYINNTSCKYKPLESKLTPEARSADGNSHNYCEVCERIILGDNVYAIHLKSHRHMKVLKKKKKLEQSNQEKTKSE